MDRAWWTVLALYPRYHDFSWTPQSPLQQLRASYVHKFPFDDDTYQLDKSVWGVMLDHAHKFMETASHCWDEIADYLEGEVMTAANDDVILHENGTFSQSTRLFWIINTIDESLPIIIDSVMQWDRFWKIAESIADSDLDLFTGYYTFSKEEFGVMIQKIEDLKRRLWNSDLRFKAIRERARSLRDGVSSTQLFFYLMFIIEILINTG